MSVPSASPALRPLPSRPSLEYERKEAKALLRRLKAGDRQALARIAACHPGLDPSDPSRVRLADAQLVVAREYGFAGWPRLVRWFNDAERQRHAVQQLHGDRAVYEAHVRHLLAGHRAGAGVAARHLAAYVPRFYGRPASDVLTSVVSEDDARLAVARTHGSPSWEAFLQRVDAAVRSRAVRDEVNRAPQIIGAMAAGDLEALERIVAVRPELLRPSEYDDSTGYTLMSIALGQERKAGAAAMRPIMDWLSTRGFDRQRELNARLCGHLGMTPDEVRVLLDAGADPSSTTPAGIPVLEQALLRYWNGDAVDVLATRATPRRALWIAAGLGDVNGVRGFLDRQGKPTLPAGRLRPDFVAGRLPLPTLPDADDEELLAEALLVSVLNGRTAVLEYLASRGAPLNTLVFGMPLVAFAAANGMVPALECLVRCGADLDLRGETLGQSARELARELLEQQAEDSVRRRVAELCGVA